MLHIFLFKYSLHSFKCQKKNSYKIKIQLVERLKQGEKNLELERTETMKKKNVFNAM